MNKKAARNKISEMLNAYERILNIRICINTFTGEHLDLIPARRHYHNNFFCKAVKNISPRARKFCADFDNMQVPSELKRHGGGIWKLCHGGLLEYSRLLLDGERITGKVCFGQFIPGKDLKGFFISDKCPEEKYAVKELCVKAEVLEQEKADMLRVIFDQFCESLALILKNKAAEAGAVFSRKDQIDEFMGRKLGQATGLGDLAAFLGLSKSRTAVVLKEIYGKNFADILREKRIDYAAEILLNSPLSCVKTAQLCGYNDPAYFHRCFKKEKGCSAGEYRKIQSVKTMSLV